MNNGIKSEKSLVEIAKKKAAIACVNENVKSNQVIGIGTGSTSAYAIEHLAERYSLGQIVNIVCIPTSIDSRYSIIKNNLPLSDLEQNYIVDVYIDGADEVDQRLDCIKGAGGCLTEEKIVMGCSKQFYLIADYRKKSQELGQHWKSIPIEVCRSAHMPISKLIAATEGGSCTLRVGSGKAGPLVTDNGNFIIDWFFPAVNNGCVQWNAINTRITMMCGVLETGLFLNRAHKAYFGMEDGSVLQLAAPAERLNQISNGSVH